MERPFGLTTREIILIHLLDLLGAREFNPLPVSLTQIGMADLIGTSAGSLGRVLKPMVKEKLLEEVLERVEKSKRKRITYWLTKDGIEEARPVIEELRGQTRIIDGERVTVGELLDRMDGTHLYPRIVALSAELGEGKVQKIEPIILTVKDSGVDWEYETLAGFEHFVLSTWGAAVKQKKVQNGARYTISAGSVGVTTISIDSLGGRTRIGARMPLSTNLRFVGIFLLGLLFATFSPFAAIGVTILLLIVTWFPIYKLQNRINGTLRAALFLEKKRFDR